jgi:hypothetical protein
LTNHQPLTWMLFLNPFPKSVRWWPPWPLQVLRWQFLQLVAQLAKLALTPFDPLLQDLLATLLFAGLARGRWWWRYQANRLIGDDVPRLVACFAVGEWCWAGEVFIQLTEKMS